MSNHCKQAEIIAIHVLGEFVVGNFKDGRFHTATIEDLTAVISSAPRASEAKESKQ